MLELSRSVEACSKLGTQEVMQNTINRLPFLPTHYLVNANVISRLNARWLRVVQPLLPEIKNKKVLDLGAHDGRWAFAYAEAGAAHVTAVEARSELCDSSIVHSNPHMNKIVSFVNDDIFSFLNSAVAKKSEYDVVALLGILYHIYDHYGLFVLISQLKPSLIIIDSEFIRTQNSISQILSENTSGILNAIPKYRGQTTTLVGVLSDGAIEKIGENLGYQVTWYTSNDLDSDAPDYRRKTRKRRRTCYMRKL